MSEVDPIFIKPRMLPRRWGRDDLGEWCASAPRPGWPVGEVWIAHAANVAVDSAHLGAQLSGAPQEMFGDLGRAPPSLRLVFSDAETDPFVCDAHTTLWRIIDAPVGAQCEAGANGALPNLLRCRTGDGFRVSEGGRIKFPRGVVALEARSNFAPRNHGEDRPRVTRLAPAPRSARSAWLRDAALSVELWRLPHESRLEPDGETCHVLMALTNGVALDGRVLAKGEAAFIPACGRSITLLGGGGAEALVVYPDVVPTAIWRCRPEPDPAAAALRRSAAYPPNAPADAVAPALMEIMQTRAA